MSDLMSRRYLASVYGDFPSTFYYDTHPIYDKFRGVADKIRDVLEGSDRVKARGTKYLPRLKAQSDEAYKAYVGRALFFNATARIHSTNIGTITRRSPYLEYNDEMSEYFEDDSSSMYVFNEVLRFIISELIAVGRVGVLSEVCPIHNRPIPIFVRSEQIITWTKSEYGDVTSIVIARPKVKVDPASYKYNSTMVYYILTVKGGVYTVTTVDEDGKPISEVQPSVHGKTLSYIPFTCITPAGLDIEPVKSPINDVADINISHYRTSADLETGRHFCGLPQAIVSGATVDGSLYVGSEEAWVLPSDKAKAYYLEFIGQGLDGLANALKEKDSQMSQFSAQLLDTSSKGSEAEGTVRLRYASDAANLSTIAQSAENGLNRIYKSFADWLKTKAPTVILNKDFISDKLSHNDLRELTKAWYDGSISDEEYRYNLKRGEIIPINEKLGRVNSAVKRKEKEAADKLAADKAKATTATAAAAVSDDNMNVEE